MWLGFLPQALLRKLTRGGRAGRREVAKRFLCVNEGDWGNLVKFWQQDSLHFSRFRERRQLRRAEQEQEYQAVSLRKNVLSLLHRGHV